MTMRTALALGATFTACAVVIGWAVSVLMTNV